MKAEIRSLNGTVKLHDLDSNTTIIAMTASEALWLSFFLQTYLQSELILQLKLAAKHADETVLHLGPDPKIFPLKRGL